MLIYTWKKKGKRVLSVRLLQWKLMIWCIERDWILARGSAGQFSNSIVSGGRRTDRLVFQFVGATDACGPFRANAGEHAWLDDMAMLEK
jgi:hypothetical protein